MRNPWVWILLALVALGALAQYLGVSAALSAKITVLASQPSVSTSFQDPESGRTDALTTLIAFAILTPIAAAALLLGLVLLAKALEAVVVSCHLPGWLSTPAVGLGTIAAVYATTEMWMPSSLHALGLVARAYLIYTNGNVPVIR